MSDPHAALLRAFQHHSPEAGGFTVIQSHARPWASVTFTGARHRFTLVFSGEDAAARAERFSRWVENYEFALPGHLVADVTAEACGDSQAALEVLTLEER